MSRKLHTTCKYLLGASRVSLLHALQHLTSFIGKVVLTCASQQIAHANTKSSFVKWCSLGDGVVVVIVVGRFR